MSTRLQTLLDFESSTRVTRIIPVVDAPYNPRLIVMNIVLVKTKLYRCAVEVSGASTHWSNGAKFPLKNSDDLFLKTAISEQMLQHSSYWLQIAPLFSR